ncbi:MAG TPA: XrtA/PEP-CTERM system histidine kinase PrsK [Duganella sp.]|nr:XrtA/PEP-CTERM system histidine kinase PrsK [Duganella sp.]
MQCDGAAAVAVVSHAVALAAFGALAAWLLLRGPGAGGRASRQRTATGLAALATALWAACAIGAVLSGAVPLAGPVAATAGTPGWRSPLPLDAAEALRDACWLALLLMLAGAGRRVLAALLLLPAACVLMAAVAQPPPLLRAALPLALAVLGMLLVEHVYRAAPQSARWGIKFSCLGIGALFAFDFYLYSDAMLFRRLHPDIWAARGIVSALSAPLLAVAMSRNPAWTPGLQLSRQIMFHSAALLGSALYLLLMAVCAWYLRYVGGAWGTLMQAAFLCGAALLLSAVLFSGAVRARLKLFISKHFYTGRYDYREEWQRFTRALADDADGLPERAIQAIAGLVESPAGLLWLRRESDSYQPSARWNMPMPHSEESVASPLCQLLASRSWVIELADWREPPAWSAGLWLVVPLMLDRSLFGFIALAPPRTTLQLNWEVRDVLKIAGSQAASYISHRAAADSLAVARQFDSFNRMSTFVVHDLKNLVSQLSLLLVNAEKHKANPAFQADMLETLSHSLAKMRHMLLKLGREQSAESSAPLHLDQLLARAVRAHAGSEPRPALELRTSGLTVLADSQRLERVIGHLIQNAVEATPRGGHVVVRLRASEGAAVVEISDTGHGMSEQFISERLFQPFVSTKAAGMGIGVFESREYVREIGGQLHVTSAPSKGTTFRITLPLHKESVHGEE